MNRYINNHALGQEYHIRWNYLFAFYLASDLAILKRFAREEEVVTLQLYLFKIIRYMIIRERWKDIFSSFVFSRMYIEQYILNNMISCNFAAFYRHFIIRMQIHICNMLLALTLFASRYFVFFFNRTRGYTSTRGSPSSIPHTRIY